MTRDAAVWVTPETDADGFLPEGPRAVTLGGREAVAWVNIQTAPDATSGAIFARFWDTGEVRRFPLADRPGFLLPTDRPDTLLVGAGKSLLLVNPLTGATELLATMPDANPRTIINDAEVVPNGLGAVFGTKDVNFKDPLAHLYLYVTYKRQVTAVADGMTCSNGKVIHRQTDRLSLWDIDTPKRCISRYEIGFYPPTATPTADRLDLSAEPGFPDGMVDAGDGTVIVAFYNPEPTAFGVAKRFRLDDGAVLDEWRTPGSPRVTCPLLVRRPDGLKLVLTTATEGMPADQRASCPHAGSLFIAAADGLDPPASELVRLS
jgi:sugar lactone lactonase YvrE